MKTIFKYILLSFICVSCGSNDNSKEMADDMNKAIKDADSAERAQRIKDSLAQPVYFDYKNTSLANDFTDTLFVKFSNDTTEDCFTFFAPKGRITETIAVLRITNKHGRVIYKDVFYTSELISGYATAEIKTDAEMVKYVLEQAKAILHNGIIDPNKLPEYDYLLALTTKEDFLNYDAYNEIKKKKRLMFFYSLHEESGVYIGYYDEAEEVVEIARCC